MRSAALVVSLFIFSPSFRARLRVTEGEIAVKEDPPLAPKQLLALNRGTLVQQ